MDEILNCPFCGGKARWEPTFIDGTDWGNIGCQKCGANSDYRKQRKATALWNTRTQAQSGIDNG